MGRVGVRRWSWELSARLHLSPTRARAAGSGARVSPSPAWDAWDCGDRRGSCLRGDISVPRARGRERRAGRNLPRGTRGTAASVVGVVCGVTSQSHARAAPRGAVVSPFPTWDAWDCAIVVGLVCSATSQSHARGAERRSGVDLGLPRGTRVTGDRRGRWDSFARLHLSPTRHAAESGALVAISHVGRVGLRRSSWDVGLVCSATSQSHADGAERRVGVDLSHVGRVGLRRQSWDSFARLHLSPTRTRRTRAGRISHVGRVGLRRSSWDSSARLHLSPTRTRRTPRAGRISHVGRVGLRRSSWDPFAALHLSPTRHA